MNTEELNVHLLLAYYLSCKGSHYQKEICCFLVYKDAKYYRPVMKKEAFYMYRAWITIDNRLYLWNYASPQEYEIYEGVSEIILSVFLAAPKRGMFVDSIT